jgi:hypothetical protein
MIQKTITIKLKGGIGNQLFQYAAAKNISEKNESELLIDAHSGFVGDPFKRSFALNVFNVSSRILDPEKIKQSKLDKIIKYFINKINRLIFKKFRNEIVEKTYHFDEAIEKFKVSQSIILEGYFHSEKYFKNIRSILLMELEFINSPSVIGQKYLNEISKLESVSVHFRKYDNNTIDTSSINGICSIDYYQTAIKFIQHKLQNPFFYFFSDDIEWTKNFFTISELQVKYIDYNNAENSYEDLRLMSVCKHNIIANSSFSWWGAWLNVNPDKIVIAPKKWLATDKYDYKDVVPENWLKF